MRKQRALRSGSLVLCAILAGCAHVGASPALTAGSAPSADRQPDRTSYLVYQFSGKGNTSAEWHAHSDKNDCHGTVTAWAATGSFYVNTKTGALYTKSATKPILTVELSLEGTCTDGSSGDSAAAADYILKSGEVKRPDPPSNLSFVDVSGDAVYPDTDGNVQLIGPACNAKVITTKYREGNSTAYMDIDPLDLGHVRSEIGCDTPR